MSGRMIILVLVVIWLVALAPFVLRKLSEHQITASLAHFRELTGMGRRGRSVPQHDEDQRAWRNAASTPEEDRRVMRARARVRRQRRRRALAALGGCGAFTLVFGAIPELRTLWDLTIADVVLTAGYLALLAYFTKLENFQAERRAAMRNVVPIIGRPTSYTSARPEFAAVGGGSNLPAPIPIRPAFRIIEAPG